MNVSFLHWPCWIGILLLGFTGCQMMGPEFDPYDAKNFSPSFKKVAIEEKLSPENLRPPKEPFKLGPGDSIEIELIEQPNTRQSTFVMPDGKIYYHVLRGFKASGMTLPELKKALEERLSEYYQKPQVTVILRGVSSQKIWILGQVNKPGIYPLTGPTTLIEALSMAGGLFTSRFSGTTEELADLKHSFLVRDGKWMPVDFYTLLNQGDLSQNIYLKNGDYIYLPSATSKEVYVLGAVRQPKAVAFMDQVTVISAIANAKGVLPGAYVQRIVIIRGSMSDPKVAIVNLNDLTHGKACDVLLEPKDIVWVPNSPFERIEDYAKLILGSYVRTIAINEGGRFGSDNSSNTRVSVGVGGSQ